MSKCRVVHGLFFHVFPPTSKSDIPPHFHSHSLKVGPIQPIQTSRLPAFVGQLHARTRTVAVFNRCDDIPARRQLPADRRLSALVMSGSGQVKYSTHVHRPRTTHTVAEQDDPPFRGEGRYFQRGIPEAWKRRPPGDDSHDGICSMRNQFRRPIRHL